VRHEPFDWITNRDDAGLEFLAAQMARLLEQPLPEEQAANCRTIKFICRAEQGRRLIERIERMEAAHA
jgi:hypothetical protein